MSQHKSIVVSPAYGRDYKSADEAIAAWRAGKDFRLHTINGRPVAGEYCSIRDFAPIDQVCIRHNKLRRPTYVDNG